MLGQQLQVTKHPHLPGRAGVNYSLEQVANKIAKGYTHYKVVTWARNQLERGRRDLGLKMDTDRDRARALLRAVQKKLWIPDPVHTEFIASPHLLACDKDTPDQICMLGADCDELTALLGACFLAVGLPTAVVGLAFDSGKNISHVLTSVWVDGKWQYADPSTQFNLGEVVEFTAQKVLSVPNVRVVCEADICFRNGRELHPEKNSFAVDGHYIGVDGVPPIPKFAWLRKRPQMLGQTLEERGEAAVDACLDVTLRADVSTAAARERAFGGGARCAADAFCATYAIPPGICSSIAGPVADAIASFWSDIFGTGPSVDCSKVSTFDPCHDCKLLSECLKLNPLPAGLPNFQEQQARTARIAACMNQRRRACYEAERKRIAAATLVVANRAAADAQKKRDRTAITMSVGAGAAAGAALWYFLPAVRSFLR